MRKLSRYRNQDLLSRLSDDINRLMQPSETAWNLDWPEISTANWVPSIDVRDEGKEFLVHADLPGVKAADIDVHMENGVLTIRGKRESEIKEEKENYLRLERSTGSFLRQLSFPETVDSDRIHAKCQDGVLEVRLPKLSKTEGRKIKVEEK